MNFFTANLKTKKIKSHIFCACTILQELLHKAELEDQQRDSFFSSSQLRGNSRRHHTGGSLQDLVDVNNEQLLDYDCTLGSQARRHQQHSRYTKNSSSVSSRQREGGSLPNNVNSSSYYPVSSFSLSKYPKSNTKITGKIKIDAHDYERTLTNHHRNTIIGDTVSYCEEPQSSIPSTSASISCANEKPHTIINIDDPEEARHLLAHDSLGQDTNDANRDDGTELVSIKKHRVPTMNSFLANVKDSGESSRQASQAGQVDHKIQYFRYPTPSEPTTKLLTNSKNSLLRPLNQTQVSCFQSNYANRTNSFILNNFYKSNHLKNICLRII